MDSSLFETFRNGLQEKRKNLTDWLLAAPSAKRQTRLGPIPEAQVQVELHEIDEAIEKAEDQTLGLCEVCDCLVDPELLEMDYNACVCLDHFSDDEKRALEAELELAQVVQRAMLPRQAPDIPCMEIAAYSRPAQIVGGDYFGFSQFSDGNHSLSIGDVAGHGVSSGLLMASLQSALSSVIPIQTSPVEVIQQLNHLFSHNIHFTTFASLFLGSFDPANYQLTYANAGHNPPMLLREVGSGAPVLTYLGTTGPAIGLIEGAPYSAGSIRLQPGDLLVLYTDGVVETANPQAEFFGQAGLENVLRQACCIASREVVRAVVKELTSFAQSDQFADDTTLIVCRIV